MSEKAQDQDVVQTSFTPADQASAALHAEEVEAVITPRLSANHNENVLAARLDAEEVEAVIAPRLAANHNETVLE